MKEGYSKMITIKVKPGIPMKLDNNDNPTYNQWIDRVNEYLGHHMLSIDDLPDCNYRDWYDARIRPVRAAARAIKHAQE
jgi:hypothetical protein